MGLQKGRDVGRVIVLRFRPMNISPFEQAAEPKPRTEIDRFVLARLARLGIRPANLCSDATFLRRAYIDVIGTLPTADEVEAFQRAPDRTRLIDELLARDEYADYWAMKWSDLLRVKSEFPINLWPLAAQSYHRWIHDCMHRNVSYRRFVRDLLLADGSDFRNAPANFYRAIQGRQPEDIARTVALTFMGVRAERWPREKLRQMAVFFSRVGYESTDEWKEEIVVDDVTKPLPAKATLPDGKVVTLDPANDPREVFVNWLTADTNPWFARSIANRVWCWLLGRGVVDPADDLENPPSNPALLAELQRTLIASRYDLKALMRAILVSDTYQLSPAPRSASKAAVANFAYYTIRRLDAEVLLDALNAITGGEDGYSSQTPEPYTFVPEELRTIDLADGSVTSSFLELFGRPPRDSGFEDERNLRTTTDQRLHMLNSSHVQKKIERGPKMQAFWRDRSPIPQVVSRLYLTILSRDPTVEESTVACEYVGKGVRSECLIDVAWALINSVEFQFRH